MKKLQGIAGQSCHYFKVIEHSAFLWEREGEGGGAKRKGMGGVGKG